MIKFHCDQCGQKIHPSAKFCPICGSEVPQRTMMERIKQEKIKEPIFCPQCKVENWNYSLYCVDCGEDIYKKTSIDYFHCPNCGEKNLFKANSCFNCVLSFDEWFSQSGKVAERLGFKGNLILHETMNEIIYKFLTYGKIDIGRSDSNAVVINSDLVSSRHCSIDITIGKLSDLGSTNGTYVNRSNKKIDQIELGRIDEFNIAGSFTFKVIKDENSFGIRLTAILDEEESNKHSDNQALNKLRKEYFILLSGDSDFYIRKFDGELMFNRTREEDFYSIKYRSGYFYFSENSEEATDRLVHNNYYQFPNNWEVKLESFDNSEIPNDSKITA